MLITRSTLHLYVTLRQRSTASIKFRWKYSSRGLWWLTHLCYFASPPPPILHSLLGKVQRSFNCHTFYGLHGCYAVTVTVNQSSRKYWYRSVPSELLLQSMSGVLSFVELQSFLFQLFLTFLNGYLSIIFIFINYSV